jgi:hypothetical protein
MRNLVLPEIKSTFKDPQGWQPYHASTEPFSIDEMPRLRHGNEVSTHSHSGEIKLIIAIFNQCIHDITKAPEARAKDIKSYRLNSWRFHSAEAQLFMNVNNPALVNYCSSLGLTPQRVVERFKTHLYKLRRGILCTA